MRAYEQALRRGVALIDAEASRLHLEIEKLERERAQLARLLKGAPAPPVPEEENRPLDARVKNLRKHIDADLPPELREVEYEPDDVILGDVDEGRGGALDDEGLEEEFSFDGGDGFSTEPALHAQIKHSGPYPSLSSGNGIRDMYGDSAIDHLFPNEHGAKDDEMEM